MTGACDCYPQAQFGITGGAISRAVAEALPKRRAAPGGAAQFDHSGHRLNGVFLDAERYLAFQWFDSIRVLQKLISAQK